MCVYTPWRFRICVRASNWFFFSICKLFHHQYFCQLLRCFNCHGSQEDSGWYNIIRDKLYSLYHNNIIRDTLYSLLIIFQSSQKERIKPSSDRLSSIERITFYILLIIFLNANVDLWPSLEYAYFSICFFFFEGGRYLIWWLRKTCTHVFMLAVIPQCFNVYMVV